MKYKICGNWINWVIFVFSWVCLLGSQTSLISGFLAIWLIVLFTVIVILEKMNVVLNRMTTLQKDLDRKIDDYIHCQVISSKRRRKLSGGNEYGL